MKFSYNGIYGILVSVVLLIVTGYLSNVFFANSIVEVVDWGGNYYEWNFFMLLLSLIATAGWVGSIILIRYYYQFNKYGISFDLEQKTMTMRNVKYDGSDIQVLKEYNGFIHILVNGKKKYVLSKWMEVNRTPEQLFETLKSITE